MGGGQVANGAWGAPRCAGVLLGGAAAAAVGCIAGTNWHGRVIGACIGALLATAAQIDIREHRLPNRIVGGVFALGVTVAFVDGRRALASSLLGAVVVGAAVLVVHLRRGLGMGDVKAAGAIGAALGPAAWWAAPGAIAVAAASAAAAGLMLRRNELPMGPSLVAGWAIASLAVVAWRA